jgi:hypothetical protein
MAGNISSIEGAQLRAKLREINAKLDKLGRQVSKLVVSTTGSTSGKSLLYIGEYAGSSESVFPSPSSDPKIAKLNQQGSAYGDEYWISGRLGDGTVAWKRIIGFPDS